MPPVVKYIFSYLKDGFIIGIMKWIGTVLKTHRNLVLTSHDRSHTVPTVNSGSWVEMSDGKHKGGLGLAFGVENFLLTFARQQSTVFSLCQCGDQRPYQPVQYCLHCERTYPATSGDLEYESWAGGQWVASQELLYACQPKEGLPEMLKEHCCEHPHHIWPLRAAANTGHLALLPREEHERNRADPSLCFHSLVWLMLVSTCKINQFFLQMSLCSLTACRASVHAGLRAQYGFCNAGDAALCRNPWNGILSWSGFCSSSQIKH